MSHSKLTYAVTAVAILGAVLYGGLVPGAVLAFAVLIVIGGYRRYTGQEDDHPDSAKTPAKKNASPSASKPKPATHPKKPEKLSKPSKSAPAAAAPKPKIKISTWKNPPRR